VLRRRSSTTVRSTERSRKWMSSTRSPASVRRGSTSSRTWWRLYPHVAPHAPAFAARLALHALGPRDQCRTHSGSAHSPAPDLRGEPQRWVQGLALAFFAWPCLSVDRRETTPGPSTRDEGVR